MPRAIAANRGGACRVSTLPRSRGAALRRQGARPLERAFESSASCGGSALMAELQRLLATGTCSPFTDVEVPSEGRLEPRDVEDAEATTHWSGRINGSLLDECIEGDETAWRLLHRLCYPRAAAFLWKLGVRELDLEEAAQEVFVQLFRY